MSAERERIATVLEQLFDELATLQRKKVFAAAQRLNPRLTEDDVQQPHDFPELAGNAEWNYEDGVLAGYLAAQMAVRARLLRDG
jgi:hypothetical protein